jgi:SAM-dependent methyltransferase
VPLAARAADVYGVEAADGLREQAAAHLEERNVGRVRLTASLADLRGLRGTIDFVHSTLAFPHMRRREGERSLAELVDLLGPGGCGVIHVLVGRRAPGWRRAAGAARARGLVVRRSLGLNRNAVAGTVAPELNAYDLDSLLVLLAEAGISETWVESVVQGHAVDVNLFFQRRA